MRFHTPEPARDPAYAAVLAAYRADESGVVAELLKEATLPAALRDRIAERARGLVREVRAKSTEGSGIDAFMHQYQLSSQEGIVLMCLAEALLRVPDAATRDALIRDKIGSADWSRHLGQSESAFVNASTWGLMLTGRFLRFERDGASTVLRRLIARSGEPLIRQAVTQAMRILGRQFVMGRTIEEALKRARDNMQRGYCHSFDMLGESARTALDAERYLHDYERAIRAIGQDAAGRGPRVANGISIKLSALHPRYELAQGERACAELAARVRHLAAIARDADINFTIDAEEADRLDLSAEIIAQIVRDPAFAGWEGFGLAVQAYQKRARPFIDWLIATAAGQGRRLTVRLVKGAYWDSEVKRAQERGLDGYPVFTRKANSDVSYLACARRLLAVPEVIYPQFATHNAQTAASIFELADGTPFEFQRLHGMGEALHAQFTEKLGIPCRIYAPVGSHEDLLAYLVRRLLENGSNNSFVNRLVDEQAPIDALIADPAATVAAFEQFAHPRIPLPAALYGAERRNSAGVDLSDVTQLSALSRELDALAGRAWSAAPLIGGQLTAGPASAELRNPASGEALGSVVDTQPAQLAQAVERAWRAFALWDATPAAERAACLERAAERFESERAVLLSLLQREAGKTLADAIAELREAVDFCRYYAARARAGFAAPIELPGPTGESNRLEWRGRGVFACISPWNFPLAIFSGQIAAALVTGNTVIAKPAEQTPLIAAVAVRLLHAAGVPVDALQLLPGDGNVGAALVDDVRIAGVAFTGSTATAWAINRRLAAKNGPIVPLIAETGGLNALVVDSSALPEQVVEDVITSAFRSAGQRCSALRLLLVQDDVAERLLTMLGGAMAELRIGDPLALSTDVGPLIDAEALAGLAAHVAELEAGAGRLIYRCTLADGLRGHFLAPQAWEIPAVTALDREFFGPILHVVRWRTGELERTLDALNAGGYGLTFGIHSRIDSTIRAVLERVRAGNCYVNRSIIGAVVGVQPFGGEGLSGTGPKAGGPHYLQRFAVERTVSVNTTASGGNAALMTLGED
ncbi:bifunctional proline dehydrogenase/L-glutamate gamma-semialdehyde dehydrogenase PutA [Plasticicumulans acidivorans]|uniref:Bifunctional protein PutA n=1 Tax=Plasticicumulans acidivorans TaxID=886464 RepID=A0A317MR25_9GAMM|nr:bifunctional proline dehydrogenase/L-glutamate gamma-semialdehyde dehydrogenase PutA [Plasticicumulans acidivorans]PWV58912.1 L-proline dehydrogenase /delta-1-pyrroline-5-carboxylate dehydrogenase [Plasticicumulans acidivorans]